MLHFPPTHGRTQYAYCVPFFQDSVLSSNSLVHYSEEASFAVPILLSSYLWIVVWLCNDSALLLCRLWKYYTTGNEKRHRHISTFKRNISTWIHHILDQIYEHLLYQNKYTIFHRVNQQLFFVGKKNVAKNRSEKVQHYYGLMSTKDMWKPCYDW